MEEQKTVRKLFDLEDRWIGVEVVERISCAKAETLSLAQEAVHPCGTSCEWEELCSVKTLLALSKLR